MRIKLAFCFLASALFVQSARADVALGAPGVQVGTQVATKVPFKNTLTLPNSYKFVFSGIEAQGNTAGAPGCSGTNGNGGQFHVSATVSDNQSCTPNLKEGKIEFRDIGEFNTSPLKTLLITPAAIFRASTTPISIKLEWAGQGNAHKPNGTFNILGEHQKDPPVPTGNLNFAVGEWMLVTTGDQQPESIVTIVRE